MRKFKNPLNRLILILALFCTTQSHAVVEPKVASGIVVSEQTITKKTLELTIGRPLTWKEKLAFPLIKRQLLKSKKFTTAPFEEKKTDGLAVAGFICGLVSVFVAGIILGILGIIFSAIALGRIKNNPDTRSGRGLAIAGLILGIVGVIGAVIVISQLK